MSYFQARLAEVQIPPKKPQKYLFHVPRTTQYYTKPYFYVGGFAVTVWCV